MGLIKAALSSASSTLADQWKDFITVDALNVDTLVLQGHKQQYGSNTKGSVGVISRGSKIVVPVGTAMAITDNGKIVEFSAEAGEFIYDSSTEPSCFTGGFGQGLLDSFKTFGKRFTFGGETARDQRVYNINLKEIIGNKFGSAQPMPYQDPTYKNIYIRYFGQYSFKISDPIRFFSNIAGNVTGAYTRGSLMEQCTAEFYTALDTALNKCADDAILFSRLPSQQQKLATYMNDALDNDWRELRGMEIVSVAIEKVTPDDRSRERIEKFDTSELMSDQKRAVGRMVDAQATFYEEAGKNGGGAGMAPFVGIGMAGGLNPGQSPLGFVQQANAPAAPQPADGWKCECGTVNTGAFCQSCGKKKPEPQKAESAEGWVCSCGTKNTGKFCANCGAKKPESTEWVCGKCGTKNTGKFCAECGEKFEPAKHYKCDKCGWEPEDNTKPPKFCPNCGDPINDGDIV